MYGKLMFNELDDAIDFINENGINLVHTQIVPCPRVVGTDVEFALVLHQGIIDRIEKKSNGDL